MLTYTMDVEPSSIWLRTTPGHSAQEHPYIVTEAGLFYSRKNFVTSRANKESYLILYTISGEGFLRQGNQEIHLQKGDAVLINCRSPQIYGTLEGASKWHHFWIHCDGSGVRAMEPILNAEGILHPMQVSSAMRDRFEQILIYLRQDNLEAVLESSLMVHRILTRMAGTLLSDFQGGKGSPLSSGRSNKELMEQAAEYIRAHFTEEITLEQLIAMTHLSRSYFLKLFKQYIGATPYNYLICYRITQAKEFLEMTDLPIHVIAEKVGFHDESNFSTRFTKIAGQTPRAYRAASIALPTREGFNPNQSHV